MDFMYSYEDLDNHSGIKIRNSQTECYLKRQDEDGEYWVKCRRLDDSKIIEVERVSEDTLLDRLNSDPNNYKLL